MDNRDSRFIKALEAAKFTPKVIEKYDDINGTLPLVEDISGKGLYVLNNTHLGQRKLLLSEMQFYLKIQKGTVIYAGSAPGEHTPVILKLFPNLNFIMVDPHLHIMDYPYQYIYKKVHSEIQDSGYVLGGSRAKYLTNLVEHIKKVKCGTTIHNALKEKTFGSLEDWDPKAFNECRVFVIQDYISSSLAKQLRKKLEGPIFYVSDIRSENRDLNILFDNALQLVVQRGLSKDFSQGDTVLAYYKFVLPKYNRPDDVEDIEKNYNSEKWMHDVFKEAKDLGYDFIGDYPNKTYTYLDGDVYLQPWARKLSGETRLMTYGLTKKTYCPFEWRMKFNYHNVYRAYCYNDSKFLLSDTKWRTHIYDGCSDCVLEMHILDSYIKRFGGRYNDIKKSIDKITYFGLNEHPFSLKSIHNKVNFVIVNRKYTFKDGIVSKVF
jgi:hypothetical protein